MIIDMRIKSLPLPRFVLLPLSAQCGKKSGAEKGV